MKLQSLISILYLMAVYACSAFAAAPTITSISPTNGPAGTVVTITGNDFTGSSTVKFGTANAASVTFLNITQIQATVPTIASAPGTLHITVTNSSGTSTPSSSDRFTITGSTWYIGYYNQDGNVGQIRAYPSLDLAYSFTGNPRGAGASTAFSSNNSFGAFLYDETNNFTIQDLVANTLINSGNTGWPSYSIAVPPDNAYVYCLVNTTGPNTFIEQVNVTTSNIISYNVSPSSNTIQNLAISTNGTTIYATDSGTNSNLYVFPGFPSPGGGPTAFSLGGVSMGLGYIAMDPVGTYGYVVASASNVIVQFQTANPSNYTYIPVSSEPVYVIVNAENTKAYVLSISTGSILSVYEISLPDLTVSSPHPIPGTTGGYYPSMAITPDDANLIISDGFGIYEMSTQTFSVSTLLSGTNLWGIAFTPDPSPVASFTVTPANVGAPTSFDGSGSVSPVGSIASYFWSFGDGDSETTLTPTTTHTYTSPSPSITATLTVTNSAGTSTNFVYTGRMAVRSGSSAAQTQQTFSIEAGAPIVTGISPDSGPVDGGTSVTITGFAFTGATAVDFGSTAAASFTVDSDTQITATSPAGTGSVHVTVTTPDGTSSTSSADVFTYLAVPSVTAINPTSGPSIGGTSVTITGVNFTDTTAVDFGTTAATSFIVDSDTQITAISPAGTGDVHITVTNPDGTSAETSADLFTYFIGPIVTGLSPDHGPAPGGTTVTISGINFTGATAVDFGSTSATSFNVDSDTQITATSPAGTAGTIVDVTVTTSLGTSPTTSSDEFTYTLDSPQVHNLDPSQGSPAGGTSVIITGVYFTGATSVTFGGIAATSFTVDSDTTITATSPAGTPTTTVYVVITTPAGSSASTPSSEYTYVSSTTPIVNEISPHHGPAIGGTVVTISGVNFIGATAVTFGSTAATSFTVDSDGQITATSPAGTPGSTVNVTVTTPSGTSPTSPDDEFTYATSLPEVHDITPDQGSDSGGTVVVITGGNFSGATSVTFGGVTASEFSVDSDTIITAISPAGTAGTTVPVVVTTPAGSSTVTLDSQFTYTANIPIITSLTPSSGAATGGTVVIIRGSYFTGTTSVTFGGTAATSFTVNSDDRITAIAPAGKAGSIVHVTVTTSQGSSVPTTSSQYSYLSVPTVTKLTPNEGAQHGGNTVIIKGTGFNNATAVTFGTKNATSFTVNSTTQITAIAPGTVKSTVYVKVTTPGGTSAANAASRYTYLKAPDSPRNLTGEVINNRFAAQTDIIHKITWAPSTDNRTIVSYRVYRNGTLLATIKAPHFVDDRFHNPGSIGSVAKTSQLEYEDHNRLPNVSDVYQVTAIDEDGIESQPATVVVPKK